MYIAPFNLLGILFTQRPQLTVCIRWEIRNNSSTHGFGQKFVTTPSEDSSAFQPGNHSSGYVLRYIQHLNAYIYYHSR